MEIDVFNEESSFLIPNVESFYGDLFLDDLINHGNGRHAVEFVIVEEGHFQYRIVRSIELAADPQRCLVVEKMLNHLVSIGTPSPAFH